MSVTSQTPTRSRVLTVAWVLLLLLGLFFPVLLLVTIPAVFGRSREGVRPAS
jgi:hypothetical protein